MLLQYLREKKDTRLFIEQLHDHPDYTFIETLGVGSYGVAYLLQHKKTHKKYVLKRLRLKHKHKAKTKSNFHQEIAFLKKEMHPHVPSIKENGDVCGLPYYIMDYIDGHTFEQLIFQMGRTFSVEESLKIVKQLLEISMTIHSNGIVHRDLRIPNILLRHDELYVIDFGLACYIGTSIQLDSIHNPKKAASYVSDLYYIGHFFLYLLYSNYSDNGKKEKPWQEELQLPCNIQDYIERLLLIQPAFPSSLKAYEALTKMDSL